MAIGQTTRGGRRFAAVVTLAAVLALGGCGGDGNEPSGTSSPESSEQTAAPTEDGGGSTEGVGNGDPDLCALFSAEDFETVLGEPAAGQPEEQAATGPLRGMCTYTAEESFSMVMIGAYNASDREQTLEMVESESVDGLGAEADWSPQTGLLIVVEGEDWYLQVIATGEGGYDRSRSIAAARLALANR